MPERLFPLFVKLGGRRCVVVGGGKVAERKVEGLLECGGAVTVVSPDATERIARWARQQAITWRRETFSPEAVTGVFLAFAATGDAAANEAVQQACAERGVLVNAVDDPGRCDFFVPSVVRRGALSIAISTEGKSPLFARRLREELEQTITGAYGEFLELLGRQRDTIKSTVPDIERREAIFRSLVDSDILDLLKAGRREEAQERIRQCISSQQD